MFERGYGISDLRSRHKIDAYNNFRLASCTKQFTAMATMLLVHDGKLHYEDRLTDIFPDFPAYEEDHDRQQDSWPARYAATASIASATVTTRPQG